jgi:hypothetical protein
MSQASCFRWHKEFNGDRGSCEIADNTIQCLFFKAGHRDLHAKKFRIC